MDYRFADTAVFSCPKDAVAGNEDSFIITETSLVVADGATAKHRMALHEGKSLGSAISRLVADVAATSKSNGSSLAAELNAAVGALRKGLGLKKARQASPAPACTLACVRLQGTSLIITVIGDTGVRLNGSGQIYAQRAKIDDLTSAARAHYIRLTGDTAGGRDFIMPLLRAQSAYRNHPTHPLGYGVIDGSLTPDQYVEKIIVEASKISTVEIFTDGYLNVPQAASIDAWEQAYAQVEREDPNRCGRYASTKTADDRTILIARVRPTPSHPEGRARPGWQNGVPSLGNASSE